MLVRDRERRAALEHAARELVLTHYDWASVAGQLEQALLRAANRVPAAPTLTVPEAGAA
jgi:hypothetical protein